jgi:hypothetical protein
MMTQQNIRASKFANQTKELQFADKKNITFPWHNGHENISYLGAWFSSNVNFILDDWYLLRIFTIASLDVLWELEFYRDFHGRVAVE